jgi:hypothetical protein
MFSYLILNIIYLRVSKIICICLSLSIGISMKKINKKRLLFSLLTVCILIGTICLTGCTEQNPSEGNSETTSGLLSAKVAWNNVKPEVEAWDPGYGIVWVNHFGSSYWADDAKETSWEFYVESANGSTSTTFTYPVNNGVYKEPDAPFGSGRNTFQASDWTIDSTEAASIAIQEIKKEKISDFNGGLKAEMYTDEDGIPYWEMEYSTRQKNGNMDLDIPLEYGTVKINAKTGDVIEITGS